MLVWEAEVLAAVSRLRIEKKNKIGKEGFMGLKLNYLLTYTKTLMGQIVHICNGTKKKGLYR